MIGKQETVEQQSTLFLQAIERCVHKIMKSESFIRLLAEGSNVKRLILCNKIKRKQRKLKDEEKTKERKDKQQEAEAESENKQEK